MAMGLGDEWRTRQHLCAEFQAIAAQVQEAMAKREQDVMALLSLLRLLEELHQEIRETAFQDALPQNRQKLYMLLRDIEVNGGWPYIQRMKLSTLTKALASGALASGALASGEIEIGPATVDSVAESESNLTSDGFDTHSHRD
ncbi:MAG: hypothetical protein AAF651_05645, partial [Cyanobacteria bacterium P01_C01_bin.73]